MNIIKIENIYKSNYINNNINKNNQYIKNKNKNKNDKEENNNFKEIYQELINSNE